MPIRNARVEDWKSIGNLLTQLGYPDWEPFLESRVAELIADPKERLMVYEDHDGSILACISLHFIPQLALKGEFARISYFAVDHTARSRGIGRAIEEYCTQAARERGCALIEVHCHSRRTDAHRFYYRQGYEESPKYLIKRLG